VVRVLVAMGLVIRSRRTVLLLGVLIDGPATRSVLVLLVNWHMRAGWRVGIHVGDD